MARTRPGAASTVAVLAAIFVTACSAGRTPNPVVGTTRYTCCNLHYLAPEINDVNYQTGTLVPLGTSVNILEVGSHSVKFQPAGHPAIKLEVRYSKDAISMQQFIDRLFITDDPRARLARLPAKKRALIEGGQVEEGMTRDEVLMALGFPPAHRTPSLSQPEWHYWANRWHQFVIAFEGDKVSRAGH